MRNFSRLIIFLSILSFFSACRTSKVGDAEPRKAVSERNKLESTVLLIDASKQRMLGNFSTAALLYMEAIRKDPGNDAAHYELARLYAAQGNFKEAISLNRKALAVTPENLVYLGLMADLFTLNNQLDEALKIHQKLTRENPRNIQMHLNLANVYLFMDKPEMAIQVFDHIESLLGFSEEISIEKQKILVSQKKFKQAIDEALRLIAFVPDQPLYYEILAELFLETKQPEKALEAYNKILELDPENANVSLYLADYHRAMGEMEKALEQLTLAFQSSNLPIEAKARILFNFYEVNAENKYFNEHIFMLLDILIEQHATEANAFLIYADFLTRDGDSLKAREMYLRAVNVDPSNYQVWQQIIFIDSDLSDYESMRVHSSKAMELFFEQPLPFLFNGMANYFLENYQESIASLEYGLQITVDNKPLKGQFLSLLGDAHYKNGNDSKAFDYYDKALELEPDNAYTLNNYSYYLALKGENLEKAKKMSGKANELQKNQSSFQDTYAWILYKMGDYTQALVWLEKALKNSGSESAVILEHYGDTLYKLGRAEEAFDYWQKAKEKGDGSEFLDKKINDRTLYE